MTCDACGGELVPRTTAADPQSGDRFAIEECRRCGLGHTVPQPADLGRYYGAAYHGGRHGLTDRYCWWRRKRFVAAAGARAGGLLLDVGCGDGNFLLSAREEGYEVMGTELKPELARARGLPVYESLEALPSGTRPDVVTMWHSLEHVRSPRAVLTRLHGLLAPGGVLVVAVPDAHGLQARLFGPLWFHLDVPRHLFHFGRRSLDVVLEATGFEVSRRWHVEVEYDVMGALQSALDAVLPRHVLFDLLRGRPLRTSPAVAGASLAAGVALAPAAVGLTGVGAALGRGGTLVVAARPRGS